MMLKFRCMPGTVAMLAALIVVSCEEQTREREFVPPRTLTQAEKQLVQSGNAFAFSLLKAARADGDQNLFVSPLSVYLALGMTANGTAGETETELAAVLGGTDAGMVNAQAKSLTNYVLSADPDVDVRIANAVFYRNTFAFKPAFLSTVTEAYEAEVKALNYDSGDAVKTINSWVKTATKGRIPGIIETIHGDDVMHLINAVYFNAGWRYAFKKDETTTKPFYTLAGAVNVPMMQRQNVFAVLRNADVELVRLPYANNAFEMVVMKPVQGVRETFLSSLNESTFNTWLADTDTAEVIVQLPKFDIAYKKGLVPVMQRLGVSRIFDASQADLTRLSDDRRLFVSDIIHSANITVDEAGTEAAAVTAVVVGVTSFPPQPPVLAFDRAFVYLVRERYSGAILFAGILDKP
jgi:serpin B